MLIIKSGLFNIDPLILKYPQKLTSNILTFPQLGAHFPEKCSKPGTI